MSSYYIGGRIIIDSNSRVPHSHRPVGALYYDVIDNYLYVVSTYGARSEWVDLSFLSPGKFKKHNVSICDNIKLVCKRLIDDKSRYMNNLANMEGKLSSLRKVHKQEKTEMTTLLSGFYNKLSLEKQVEFRETNADTKFVKSLCTVCHEHTNKKHKCLHSDCPGMCEKCLDQFEEIGLEKCPACDKEQTIECPICAVTKCSKDFMKSKHCSHGICHKCFADSFRAERPINKCPLCRAKFH